MTQWMIDAVCAQVDGDLWFPEKGGSSKEAVKICGACPVVEQCLEYALENNMSDGIWGGLPANQRKKIRQGNNRIDYPNPPTDKEVLRLHRLDYSAQQIADIYGVSERTVFRRLREAA